MNVIWGWMIAQMIIPAVTGNLNKDVRSEDEEESSTPTTEKPEKAE
jgi:hypothetical protein